MTPIIRQLEARNMRTKFVMLAVLAGLGLSNLSMAQAEAKNLSCISGISPSEQRLLRDCGPEPVEEEIVLVYEMPVEPPPPPPEPARMKHGEGGKGAGAQHDKDHAPAGGGNAGGPNSAAN
jgi:hypothetical protein